MKRPIPAGLVLVMCVAVPALAADTARSALHGSLNPGPHAVGFTILGIADPSRPSRPATETDSAPDSRARRIAVHVWYPAAPTATIAPMTFADAMVTHLAGRPAAELSRREADVRRFMSQFGPVPDEAWTRLRHTRLLSRLEAPAASGRFPLIIGALRPLSTAITSELLASHGYVVAMVDGERGADPEDAGAGLEVQLRDMEFAIPELRRRPFVHGSALAALGFSGSGFSQLLLAMRHPDMLAVCDLESAIFDDRMMWPLSRGWGYSVSALRVPFLHTYSVPLSRRENRIADFEAMRYATRYRYLVDAPGIHHWDFATEGMAASAVLGVRGPEGPRLQQAFETTNRYVLQFFNAYVKRDQEALAFLRRDPSANGVPSGLATIREHLAVTPAPTLDQLFATIADRGIDAALAKLEAAKAVDPQAEIFREAALNRLGYRVLRGRTPAESLVLFRKIVDWFPASSNAYDSLADALEAAGERQRAIDATRRGLEVLAAQELTPEQRRDMAALLEARLKRLQ
jgi:hypothetical protein